jgi:hypothetical protein
MHAYQHFPKTRHDGPARTATGSRVRSPRPANRHFRKRAVLASSLAAMVTLCIMLSACSNTTSQSSSSSGGQSFQSDDGQWSQPADDQPSQLDTGQSSQRAGDSGGPWAGTITGTITWPDGLPVANAHVDIFPQGYSSTADMPEITETTASDGSYTSRACAQAPCNNLQAWFYGETSDGFGDFCYIQLSPNPGSSQDFTLTQGEVDWVVNPQNCHEFSGVPDTSHPLSWQQAQGIVNGTLTYERAQSSNGTP